jgi:hypothetical protein
VKEIPLTQGQIALIDDEDYELVSKHKWHAQWDNHARKFYAATSIFTNGKWVSTSMHRLILNAHTGDIIDHKNNDGLDNTRKNIRKCTHAQNLMNQRISRANTSGYKGVSWNKHQKKWKAYIDYNTTRKFIGYFNTAIDAAIAYNNAALKYHGEFARLNHIEDINQ